MHLPYGSIRDLVPEEFRGPLPPVARRFVVGAFGPGARITRIRRLYDAWADHLVSVPYADARQCVNRDA